MSRLKVLFNIVIFLSTINFVVGQDYLDTSIYLSSSPQVFDENMDERYTSSEFNYSNDVVINDETSTFSRMMAQFWEWLSDMLYKTNGEPTTTNTILKIAAFVLIIGLVFYFFRSFFKNEVSGIFRRKKSIPVSDVLTKNIQKIDFAELVHTAKQQNDYRLAVRYYYLWWLKVLATNAIIKWHKDKTNSAYLYEIKELDTREKFKYLSYIYDYCWYGEFDISLEQFQKTERLFKAVIHKMDA